MNDVNLLVDQCINIFSEAEMIKKLTKHGNSQALVIDRPILELLRIDMETDLEIYTDGERLILCPVRTAARTHEHKVHRSRRSQSDKKTDARCRLPNNRTSKKRRSRLSLIDTMDTMDTMDNVDHLDYLDCFDGAGSLDRTSGLDRTSRLDLSGSLNFGGQFDCLHPTGFPDHSGHFDHSAPIDRSNGTDQMNQMKQLD